VRERNFFSLLVKVFLDAWLVFGIGRAESIAEASVASLLDKVTDKGGRWVPRGHSALWGGSGLLVFPCLPV
jgi:hypothetical protein